MSTQKAKFHLIAQMPPRTYATRAGFRQAVRHWIVKRTGREPVSVRTDDAGNCLVCGESGRCCGLHLYEEVLSHVKATTQYGPTCLNKAIPTI